MPSATDFLPAYITEFMNFVITMFPNFGSGRTSRFSAEWRRDMDLVPAYFGRFPRLCDQLVDRRHPGLHPFSAAAPCGSAVLPRPVTGSANSLRTTRPRGRLHGTIRTKRNRANRSSLSRKRFDATEDRSLWTKQRKRRSPRTEVMHPNSISRERAQET